MLPRTACSALLIALALGCNGPRDEAQPPALPPVTPPSATATAMVVASAAPLAPSVALPDAPTAPPAATSAPEASRCGGSDVDLARVLADKRCRPERDAPPAPATLASDVKVTLSAAAKRVAPGGHVDLALDVTNTSAAAVPLYFAGDLVLGVEVKNAKGARITPPSGLPPKNPDPSCLRTAACKLPTSHAWLAPGGHARATVRFDAVQTAWPATGPTECCAMHVDPVAKGALPAGVYRVKVPLPYESNQGNPTDAEIEIRVAP